MNIYVGNLSLDVTDSDLQEAFEKFGGVISADVIRKKHGGESRGFGFVEMQDQTEATSAIGELNGTHLKGQAIAVNETRPRHDKQTVIL